MSKQRFSEFIKYHSLLQTLAWSHTSITPLMTSKPSNVSATDRIIAMASSVIPLSGSSTTSSQARQILSSLASPPRLVSPPPPTQSLAALASPTLPTKRIVPRRRASDAKRPRSAWEEMGKELHRSGKKLKSLAMKTMATDALEGGKLGLQAGLKFLEEAHTYLELKDPRTCARLFHGNYRYFEYYTLKFTKIGDARLAALAKDCQNWCDFHAFLLMKSDLKRRSGSLASKLTESGSVPSPSDPDTPTIATPSSAQLGPGLSSETIKSLSVFLQDCSFAFSLDWEDTISNQQTRIAPFVSLRGIEHSDLRGFLMYIRQCLE